MVRIILKDGSVLKRKFSSIAAAEKYGSKYYGTNFSHTVSEKTIRRFDKQGMIKWRVA